MGFVLNWLLFYSFSKLFDVAGHCPHDEVPEQVNNILCEWIPSVESKILAGSPV